MAIFDGFADALKSVPPDKLQFTFDEIQTILFALSDYKEKLIKNNDDPSFPVMYGYCGISLDQICDTVFAKFINYFYK